jgi:acyl carrier protein
MYTMRKRLDECLAVAHGAPVDERFEGIDSLDYLGLILAVEGAFHVKLPSEAVEGFATVSDIHDWLVKTC